MSNTVDTRVVEMQFDNKQFEAGVRQTMNSLKELNKSLTDIGHEEVNRNLKVISDGIEALQKRFSWLGETVHKIQMNLIGAVKNIATDIIGFKEMKSGMDKYEGLMNATRTLMNATGKSAEELEVHFQKLFAYTDMTSYGFTELSNSMSQLVMSGRLKSVEDAEIVMEGFANACAHAGISTRDASEPLRTFNKAMNQGYVMADEWQSLNSKKFVTPQFRQELLKTAKAMGVLDKNGKILKGKGKGKTVTLGNMDSMMGLKWLTSDVLAETLKVYGAYEDILDEDGNVIIKANDLAKSSYKAAMEAKTFTDVIDGLKDAVSTGWSTSFKLLFGNVDQAATFFTWLVDKLITASAAISDFRNNLLQGWNEQGGRETLVDTVVYLWETLERIADIVSQGLTNVFGEIKVDDLVNLTNTVHQAVQDFYFWLGGDADPGKEIAPRFVLLRQAIEGVASVIQFLGDVATGVFNFLFGIYGEKIGTVDEVLLKIGEWGRGIKDFFDQIKKNEGVQKFFNNLLTILKPFAGILLPIITYMLIGKKILNGKHLGIIKMIFLITTLYNALMNIPVVSGLLKDLWGFITGIVSDITNMKDPEEFAANLAKRWEDFKTRFVVVFEELKKTVIDWFTDTWAKIKNWFTTELPKIYAEVKTAVANWLTTTWASISAWFANDLPKAFETGKNAVIKFFVDLWAKIKALFSGGGSESAEALDEAAGAGSGEGGKSAGPFEAIKQWLFNAWDVIVNAWNWLKEKFGPYFETIKSWLSEKWTALKQFFSVQFSEEESTSINWKGLVNRLMAMAPVLIALFLVYKIVKSMSEIKAGKLIAVAITMFAISLAINLLVDSFNHLLGGLEGLSGIINRVLSFVRENQMLIAIITFGAVLIALAGAVTSVFLAIRKWGVAAKRLSHIELKSDMIRIGDVLGQGAGAVTQTVNMIGLTLIGMGTAIYMFTQSIKLLVDILPDFFTAEDKLSAEAKEYRTKFWVAIGVIGGLLLLTIAAGVILNRKNKNTSSRSSPIEALARIILGISILSAELVILIHVLRSVQPSTIQDSMLKLGAIVVSIGIIVAITDSVAAIGRHINKGHSVFDSLATSLLMLIKSVLQLALSVAVLVATVLIMYAIIKHANQGEINNLIIAFASVVGLLIALVVAVNFLPKVKKEDKLKGFIPLVLSIIALVGVVRGLMLMNALFGLESVGIAVLELIGFLALVTIAVSVIGRNTKDSEAAATLFGVIAFLAAVGFLIEATANIDTKRIAVVFGGISLMLIAVGFLARQLRNTEDVGKSSKVSVLGMLTMMLSLSVLVAAIGVMMVQTKDLSQSHIITFMASLTVLVIGIGILASAAKKVEFGSLAGLSLVLAGVALIAVAAGFAISLIPKDTPWSVVAAFMAGLALIVLALSVLVNTVNKSKLYNSSVLKLAGVFLAFGVMAIAVAFALSLIPTGISWAVVAAFMAGMALMILGVAAVVAAANNNNVSWSTVGKIAVIMLAVAGLSAIMALVLNLIPENAEWEKIIAFLGGMALIMVGLAVLSAAVALISIIMKAVDFVTVIKAIGIIAIIFLAVIALTAIAGAVLTQTMKDFSSALFTLGEALKDFSNATADISPDRFGEVMSAVGKILEKFPDIVAVNYDQVHKFNTELFSFGNKLSSFNTKLEGVNREAIQEKLKVVDDIAAAATSMAGITDVGNMSNTIMNIGGAIRLYYESLNGIDMEPKDSEGNPIDTSKFDTMGLADMFSKIAQQMPEQKDLEKVGLYSDDSPGTVLNSFAVGITNLGTSLETFSTSMGKVKQSQVQTGIKNLKSFVDIKNALPENFELDFNTIFGGIKITKSQDGLNDFGSGIEDLGVGIATFAEKIGGALKVVNEETGQTNMDVAINAANGLKDLANALPEKTGVFASWFGDSKTTLGDFASNLSGLGSGLNNFVTKAFENGVTYDKTKLDTVTDFLTKLATASIPKDSWAIWDLTNQLVENTNMASDIKQFVTEINTIKDSDLETAVNKMVEVGKLLDEAIGTGMDTSDDTYSVEGAIENTIGIIENTVKKATEKPSGGVYLSGKYIDEGLAAGINDYAHKPEQAMSSVVRRIISQGNRVAQIKSPSRVFSEMGMYMDLGLDEGIVGYSDIPVRSVAEMAQKLIDTERGVLGIHSPSDETKSDGENFGFGFNIGLGTSWGEVLEQARNNWDALKQTFTDGYNNIVGFFQGENTIGDVLMNTFHIDKGKAEAVMEAFKKKDYASVISQLTGLGFDENTIASMFGIDPGKFLEGTSLSDMFNNVFGFQHGALEAKEGTVKVDDLNVDANSTNSIGGRSSRAGSESSNLGKQTTTVSSGGLNLSMTDGYTIGDILNRIDRLETAITNMRVVMDSGVLAGQVASGVDKELGNYATLNGRWN